MRLLGVEIEESTPGGMPTMGYLAVVMLVVFAIAWPIGYTLIDVVELVHLTEEQSRPVLKNFFRGFVGLAMLTIPAMVFNFRETIRHF